MVGREPNIRLNKFHHVSNPCSQMCCSRLRRVFLLPHSKTQGPSHGPQSPVSVPYLPPSLLHSFCPRFRDLLLLLKLSELLAFCLVSIFPELDLSSLPHSVQVSAQMVPYPRGLLRPRIILHCLPCSVSLQHVKLMHILSVYLLTVVIPPGYEKNNLVLFTAASPEPKKVPGPHSTPAGVVMKKGWNECTKQGAMKMSIMPSSGKRVRTLPLERTLVSHSL